MWWRRYFQAIATREARDWEERPESVAVHPFRPAVRMSELKIPSKWDAVLANATVAIKHFNTPCPRRLGWCSIQKAVVSRVWHGSLLDYSSPMWEQKITFCCPDEWACIEKADHYLPLKWRIEWEKRRQALNSAMFK